MFFKNLIMNKNQILFYFIVIMTFFSCTKKQSFIHSFQNNEWDCNIPVEFKFTILDTTTNYNKYIFFRNTLEYPYQNIYFFIELKYNNQLLNLDTAQFIVADKYGKWQGRGLGKLRDNYYLLNEDVNLDSVGEYQIIINHGMRKEVLNGAQKLGFKITENEQKK
tara:strand:+ start:8167 stop:8658 length:492 start_codon:yes stop_codon:yes gene_type:complete